jgi:hypothetical protein
MAANKSSPIVRRARPRMPSAQSHTENTPQIRDSVISFNLIFKSESLLMRYQENLSQNMITKTLGTIRRVLASKIFDCCIEGYRLTKPRYSSSPLYQQGWKKSVYMEGRHDRRVPSGALHDPLIVLVVAVTNGTRC